MPRYNKKPNNFFSFQTFRTTLSSSTGRKAKQKKQKDPSCGDDSQARPSALRFPEVEGEGKERTSDVLTLMESTQLT